MSSSLLRTSPPLPLKLTPPTAPLAFQQRARRPTTTTTTAKSTFSARAPTRPLSTTNLPSPPPPKQEEEREEKAAARPQRPLTRTQRSFLERALRVNQAGELAATAIYGAQRRPVERAHPELRGLMGHMEAQEVGHFAYWNEEVRRRRVRPTALWGVWRAVAGGMGWATGVMGREAAMACTEAVETEIGEHYNAQVRELMGWVGEMEARGEEVGEELAGLVAEIRRIRDEELEHLDHAVENDAKEARPYELLTGVIRAGCRGAIWVSERV